jgi:hypothetical protein
MTDVMYTRYPFMNVFTYNVITTLHFLLGGAGFVLGYGYWGGWALGIAYTVFAFTEMYLVMPLKVCPNCVYFKLEKSICISGLNLLSRRIARAGAVSDFPRRSQGPLCPDNLYLASLALPIIGIIPALFIEFSWAVLIILLLLIALLLFRFFIVFPKIACIHCRAKHICPNAQKMGLVRNQVTDQAL